MNLTGRAKEVEYAIFHWNMGDNQDLPGLKKDGSIDESFFQVDENNKTDINGRLEECFDQLWNDNQLVREDSLKTFRVLPSPELGWHSRLSWAKLPQLAC